MGGLTLVIGNKNYSSWSLRAWLCLKHFELPFEEIRIPLNTQGYKEKILNYSPSGKVPFLITPTAGIWDSLAICETLAETYPEKNGWPGDASARAVARSVSAEMHSGLFGLREHLPMNCRRIIENYEPPESAVQDINRVKQIWTECRNTYGKNGPWLFGEFSIADCMYAPVVMRFHSYCVPVDTMLKEYMDTVIAHPAMQEWITASREETEVILEEEVD